MLILTYFSFIPILTTAVSSLTPIDPSMSPIGTLASSEFPADRKTNLIASNLADKNIPKTAHLEGFTSDQGTPAPLANAAEAKDSCASFLPNGKLRSRDESEWDETACPARIKAPVLPDLRNFFLDPSPSPSPSPSPISIPNFSDQPKDNDGCTNLEYPIRVCCDGPLGDQVDIFGIVEFLQVDWCYPCMSHPDAQTIPHRPHK